MISAPSGLQGTTSEEFLILRLQELSPCHAGGDLTVNVAHRIPRLQVQLTDISYLQLIVLNMSDAQQPNGALPDSLNSSYLSSGFAPASSTKRALPFGPNPALVVIDICDAYLVPGSPLYAPGRFHSALKSCERLITTCRVAKIPIIFTRIVYSSPEDGGNWYKYKIPRALSCFDATNPLSDYPKEPSIVRPQNGELVMSKQFSSSFFGTPLASQWKGIDTLIICGYSTSGCVRATAVDAIQYGFFPWVVKDA